MAQRDYWKGKRIAVIGLGAHGEMVADVKFMIKSGALISIYDLKSEARLKGSLVFLRSLGLANYVCGSIPADDLLDMDLVILSHEYPRESSFLKPLAEKKIPIEYPETLFFKLAPPVTVVGVMGVCGKSTVISMLAPMLEKACTAYDGQGFFIIDPDASDGILAHLKKIKSGDIVLVRMVDVIVQELKVLRISPHVAVFTTLPQKSTHEETPFDILSYQTYNNFIVAKDEVIDSIHALKFQPKAKMLRTKASVILSGWPIQGRGAHDRDNAALALQAARLFKIQDEDARHILENWKSLKGHIEPVKKVKNVEFYNDSASVLPFSTEAAIQTLSADKNNILVFGGANTSANYQNLYKMLPTYIHTLILLPGSGTMKERFNIQHLKTVSVRSAPSVEEATRVALECAHKGDRVLFSPGFDAIGMDVSRKDRGDRFVRAVRGL